MASPYLHHPLRTPRQAEIDRLCARLREDVAYQDGDMRSTRRLLEQALECAQRHADSLPMSEHAYDNAEALRELIDEVIIDYLCPAEQSAKDYFDREEELAG